MALKGEEGIPEELRHRFEEADAFFDDLLAEFEDLDAVDPTLAQLAIKCAQWARDASEHAGRMDRWRLAENYHYQKRIKELEGQPASA